MKFLLSKKQRTYQVVNITMFFVFFLFLIIVVPTISASSDTQTADDIYKINSIVNYGKPCYYNGTYCSASAYCNFTVKNPDGSIKLNNIQGTNNLAYHNHSINFDKIGIWTIDMMCCDGAYCGSETFYAQVTGSGLNDNVAFYVVIFATGLVFIVLGFWKQDIPITLLGSFVLLFLGIYSWINGIAGIRDLTYSSSISMIIVAISSYISIRTAWELIE